MRLFLSTLFERILTQHRRDTQMLLASIILSLIFTILFQLYTHRAPSAVLTAPLPHDNVAHPLVTS